MSKWLNLAREALSSHCVNSVISSDRSSIKANYANCANYRAQEECTMRFEERTAILEYEGNLHGERIHRIP